MEGVPYRPPPPIYALYLSCNIEPEQASCHISATSRNKSLKQAICNGLLTCLEQEQESIYNAPKCRVCVTMSISKRACKRACKRVKASTCLITVTSNRFRVQ